MADIVIVGAGISGLYAAYQLAKKWQNDYLSRRTKSPPPIIVIMDKQPKVGGRIKSVALKPTLPTPPFQADLCAMRYYPTIMPTIANLVQSLQLAGSTNLQTSTIPAASLPLVTATYPALDAALTSTYPPSQTAVTQAIDLTTAITIATGDYANIDLLVESMGYTFLKDQVNLLTYYAEPPLAGLDEVRFANGFESLPQALLFQIRRIYQASYRLMTANGDLDGEKLSKSDFCGRFKLFLSTDVKGIDEVFYTDDESKSDGVATSSSGKSTYDWLKSFWLTTQSATSSDASSSHSEGCSDEKCPSPIYRVSFGNEKCHDGFYDCNQVIFTCTMQQMIDLDIGISQDDDCHANYIRALKEASQLSESVAPPNEACFSEWRVPKKRSGDNAIPRFSKRGTSTYSPKDIVLSKSMSSLCDRRSVASQLISFHPGAKIYLHFQQPWWDPSVFYKFCADPLLNQMIYFSPNVILIYVLGPQSDVLLDLFCQDFPGYSKEAVLSRYGQQWMSATSASTLVDYIKSRIPSIIAAAVTGPPQPMPSVAQLDSVDFIIMHYAEQTTGTPKSFGASPLTYASQFEYIKSGGGSSRAGRNESRGLWWLSGDLTNLGGGWVDTCLTTVNTYISQIAHLIED